MARFLFLLMILNSTLLLSLDDIPKFSPNIIDEHQYLSFDEKKEINLFFDKLRVSADIFPAVFIVKDLNDESIESLANRAFNTWKLGDAHKDNGLLLVLAMNNRQSRLEVGYGLEGNIPDMIALDILDNILAPSLRNNNMKKAIVESFTLAGYKNVGTDEFKTNFSISDQLLSQAGSSFTSNYKLGFILYLFYFVLLLFLPFYVKSKNKSASLEFEKSIDNYDHTKDTNLDFRGMEILLILFFIVNPGVFIFLIGSFASWYYSVLAAIAVILISKYYVRSNRSHYSSLKAFLKYIKLKEKKFQALVNKGYAVKVNAGRYDYTPSYYSSAEYRNSGRSSSSFSSSSGGSSGGGGASSSW